MAFYFSIHFKNNCLAPMLASVSVSAAGVSDQMDF